MNEKSNGIPILVEARVSEFFSSKSRSEPWHGSHPIGFFNDLDAEPFDTLGTILGQSRTVDRDQLRNWMNFLDRPHSPQEAFAAIMAWGRYPPFHREKLQKKFEFWEYNILPILEKLKFKKIDRSEAYDLINAVEFSLLGPAYFTKLMFFWSDDCYIMDQWTAKSINYLTGTRNFIKMDANAVSRRNTGIEYNTYCRIVEHLSTRTESNGSSASQIEERLFGGSNSEWRNRVIEHWNAG